MRKPSPRKVTFELSRLVANRLQEAVKATGLDASAVVDHALELFFDSQPDAEIVQRIRMLDDNANVPISK